MRHRTIFFAVLAAGFLAAPVGAQEVAPDALDAELRGMVAAPASNVAPAGPAPGDLLPADAAALPDEADLVGGDPIVISSTAVLAALLVLLLVAD